MRFKSISCLSLAVVALGAFGALAQPYPGKPIRVIVAIAAGSPTDIVMRAAANEVLGPLGQPLTIENRPGGDQVIGAEACARSAPDGYTYCVISQTGISTNPHVFSKLSYDPARDFKGVVQLWFLIQGMIISGSLPVKTVEELRVLALAKPGALNLGNLGVGGPDLHRRWLNDKWNTQIVGVPYKGSNLVMNALISGELQMSLTALGGLGGQLKAGKVRLLAVGSTRRLQQFPEVPTYAEAGLEDAPRTWWGLFAPAATPDAMVKRINSEFVRLFREPKFAEFLENQFLEPSAASPEEFAAFLKEDRQSAGVIVKKYNLPRQ
jgi:tripartite-type tricarboxylate transporter receptor subunit TctC